MDQSGEQLRLNLEALAEKLEKNASQMQTWQPDNSDPFCFSATIILPGETESKHTVIRGKLDSGCDEDWISSEIIRRAALEAYVLPLEYPETYIGFGGQPFQPSGTIKITWYASNAGMTRETTFLVHSDVPFDMVLGKIFIKEQSVFVFDKAALALRQGRFTRGKPTSPTSKTEWHADDWYLNVEINSVCLSAVMRARKVCITFSSAAMSSGLSISKEWSHQIPPI
jgi:hypothetical protein